MNTQRLSFSLTVAAFALAATNLDAADAPANVPASPAATPKTAAQTPQWVLPAIRAPRLQHRTFDSAAVKTKASYFIYTPEVYDTEKERRFPVMYWLHGTGGGLAGVRPLVTYFDSAIRASAYLLMPAASRNSCSLRGSRSRMRSA
ncbi:MAG: hypothetical protein HZA91_13585 [Verrucomicrobia bacterium]|nr:hypothetical protein [Verrucomicrobiota bacterium]